MSKDPESGVGKASVLVIEDNLIALKMMRIALDSGGYRVLEATNGRAALGLMDREPPDLIFQDLNLPDIDGLELVQRLREHPRGADVPIIAISGSLPKIEHIQTYPAGFTDFLFKPVAPSQLLRVVEAHLPPRAMTGEKPGRQRRLLIADDDPVQLKFSHRRFTELGFEVATATDGAEALEKAREAPPDAILSDVLMPRMDGFRLCHEIRKDSRLARVPVVLSSSAYGGGEDHDLARQVGAYALVLRTPDLRQEIEALVKGLEDWSGEMGSRPTRMPVERYADRIVHQLERQVQLNFRLARRLAFREAELAFLSAAAEGIERNLPVDRILSELLQSCLNAVGASKGAIYLREPDGSLSLQADLGYPATTRALVSDFFGHGELLLMAMAEEKPILSSGSRIPQDEAEALCRTAGVPLICLAPIGTRGERMGVFWMASERRSAEEDWASFAQAVARQFSQVIRLSQAFSRTAAAESKYRAIFENAIEGIFQLDPEGGFLIVNPAMARLCGYDSPEELCSGGLTLAQFFTDPARGAEFVRRLTQEGQASGFEGELSRKSGEAVRVSAAGRAVRGADGSLEGFEGRLEDITHRAKAEELTRNEETRKQQMQMKDQFLAHVSHELRTPLTVLYQLTTILLEGLAGQIVPEQKQLLVVALRNVNQLRTMIDDLLDVTRAETGKLPVYLRSVSMAEIIRETRDSLQSTAKARSITLETDIVSDLPAASADPSRVGQILSNLIGNAIKFTPDRGIVTVRARLWPDDPRFIQTIVMDTGGGIPPEEIDRIFGYLYQGPNVDTLSRKGFGIGLYLCKDLVSRQGGRIWAASQVGRGSEFSFILPADAAGARSAGLSPGTRGDAT